MQYFSLSVIIQSNNGTGGATKYQSVFSRDPHGGVPPEVAEIRLQNGARPENFDLEARVWETKAAYIMSKTLTIILKTIHVDNSSIKHDVFNEENVVSSI